jgi:hypothetical protein
MGPLHYETFDGPDDPSRLASRARRFEAFAWAACALALLLVAVGLVLRPDGLIP